MATVIIVISLITNVCLFAAYIVKRNANIYLRNHYKESMVMLDKISRRQAVIEKKTAQMIKCLKQGGNR